MTKPRKELLNRIVRTTYGAILYTELDTPTKRLATRMVQDRLLSLHYPTLYITKAGREALAAHRQ